MASLITNIQLIEKLFAALRKTKGAQTGNTVDHTSAEIADDSDYHRTKKGYMVYEDLILLKSQKKHIVLALGEAYGAYPADPYDRDITAVFLQPEDLEAWEKKASGLLKKSTYFHNSLIHNTGQRLFSTKPEGTALLKWTTLGYIKKDEYGIKYSSALVSKLKNAYLELLKGLESK